MITPGDVWIQNKANDHIWCNVKNRCETRPHMWPLPLKGLHTH